MPLGAGKLQLFDPNAKGGAIFRLGPKLKPLRWSENLEFCTSKGTHA
jgi:hypothetical protein